MQIAIVSLRDRLEDLDPRHPPCAIAQSGCSRSSADHSAPECPPRANPPSAAASKCRSTQSRVIRPRHAARLVRQQRRKDRPVKIRQHRRGVMGAPVRSFESHLDPRGNPFYEFVT